MADLELRNIVKAYGTAKVLHGIDLQIDSGEFIVFVGPSGCGKSTLLRMIAGLEDITEGEIRIGGERVNELPAAARKLAMVFQSYALYPHMTVRQNLAFGLENLRMERAEIDRRVDEAARLLQIEQLLARKPRQLSGGQRQRVAIGRCIVREPKIFLFDEPLSNLDAELRVQMRVEITNLHARLGNTMIYVTHDQVEAMTMADRIVVLRGGNIEQVGRPLDLYNDPANRFVAGFIGSPRMNMLEGTISAVRPDGVLVAFEGMPEILARVDASGVNAGEPVTLGIRPEHIATGAAEGAKVQAKVDMAEHLGSESYLYCTLPGGAAITIHNPGQTLVGRQDQIDIAFDPSACHVFRKSDGEAALPRLQRPVRQVA